MQIVRLYFFVVQDATPGGNRSQEPRIVSELFVIPAQKRPVRCAQITQRLGRSRGIDGGAIVQIARNEHGTGSPSLLCQRSAEELHSSRAPNASR